MEAALFNKIAEELEILNGIYEGEGIVEEQP